MDLIQGTALILPGDVLQAEAEPRSSHRLFSWRHPLSEIPSSLSVLSAPQVEPERKQAHESVDYTWVTESLML